VAAGRRVELTVAGDARLDATVNNLREILAALRRLFSDWPRHRRGLSDFLRGCRRLLARLFGRRRHPPQPREDCALDLPPDVYRRPDPLIYSQPYLMAMGLAVTWDNPDIQLHEPNPAAPDGLGAAVASYGLAPDHDYKVQVRIWNGSYHAPAPGLPVHLSFLSFGASTISTPIAMTNVELGVKGGAHHPAFAVFDWRTPSSGHYCLQARLAWLDDANPDNNLGQENVEVGVAKSPALFRMALRNEAAATRRFVIEADAYRLPDLPACDDPDADRAADMPTDATAPAVGAAVHVDPGTGDAPRPLTRLEESRRRWTWARRTQGAGQFPLPDGLDVVIEPAELSLGPFASDMISIAVEPAAGLGPDPVPVNVNAFAVREDGTRDFVGGVTLYTRRA
jgi:hypothetical protein